MSVAAKVRMEKEKHPERFCSDKACLWRVQTRDGEKPCPTHSKRELIEARLMTNGQHVRSILGTFDGYVYARGSAFILRREVGDTFWAVFCGVDLWPTGADAHAVIAEQLAEAPYLSDVEG